MRTALEKHSRYIAVLIQKPANLKANDAVDMWPVQCMPYGFDSKIMMAVAQDKHLNKSPIISWKCRAMVWGVGVVFAGKGNSGCYIGAGGAFFFKFQEFEFFVHQEK
jgi:hypothetical protein